MAKRSKAQVDALKALGNPKITAEYDDGSIDFEFEGQKLAMGPNASVMTPAEYMTKVYRPWQEKKKEKPKKKEKEPSWALAPSKTPCERTPELCEPRVIKHVAWDADDTIWDIKPYGIASNITGPLRLLDPDTVVEERPAYEPPAQPTLTPTDEGLRYKYGYRYGHEFGYPAQEEPEDFFLRQIDKDVEKGSPKANKPIVDVEDSRYPASDTEGERIAKELDIRYDGIQEELGMQFTDIKDTGTSFYAKSLRGAEDKLDEKRKLFGTYIPDIGNTDDLKEFMLTELRENPGLNYSVSAIKKALVNKGYGDTYDNHYLEAAGILVDEGLIKQTIHYPEPMWNASRMKYTPEQQKLKRWEIENLELRKTLAEKPSETSLEVSQIMTELTDELTTAERDKLRLFGQKAKLPTKSEVPPKEPGKKKKSAFGEPTKIYIKLMPGYRDLLDTLKEQGVTNSIISLNTKGTVKRIIDKFGLTDHYLEIRDSFDNKGKVFKEQMKTFGYKPQEAMFVDNAQSHVEDVAKSGAIPLVYGKDIKEVAQIVNYMTNA